MYKKQCYLQIVVWESRTNVGESLRERIFRSDITGERADLSNIPQPVVSAKHPS